MKIFRDRVVALLRLLLSEEAKSKNEMSPYQARILLRVQMFFNLTFFAMLTTLGFLSLGPFTDSSSLISDTGLILLAMGSYCAALIYISFGLRLAQVSWRLIAIIFGAMLSPLFHSLLLPFAIGGVLLGHQLFLRYMLIHGCGCGWSGLSFEQKKILQGISKSGLFTNRYLESAEE